MKSNKDLSKVINNFINKMETSTKKELEIAKIITAKDFNFQRFIRIADALISSIGDKGIAKAKSEAKGWDIYHLASIYLAGMDERGTPNNLSSAFAGWCKKYTAGRSF
jgi:hypothetical protein